MGGVSVRVDPILFCRLKPHSRNVVMLCLFGWELGDFAPKMLVKSSVDISGQNFSAGLRPAVCFGSSKSCFGGIRSSVFKRFEGL